MGKLSQLRNTKKNSETQKKLATGAKKKRKKRNKPTKPQKIRKSDSNRDFKK